MEVSVRELKSSLSAYLRKANAGHEVVVTSRGKPVARLIAPQRGARSKRSAEEEAIALLRSQPWIRPGTGKPRLPRVIVRIKPGEKTLAEIVTEQRG